MGAKQVGLWLLGAIATLAIASAMVGDDLSWLRTVLALPFVLFLPGYFLTAALFPARRGGLGAAERLLLAVGLSLAVATIGGLVLNRTPWGLQSGSWMVLLGAVTLGAGAVALAGRNADAVDGGRAAGARAVPRPTVPQGLALAGGALLVMLAVAVAHQGARAQQGATGFTQLWLVPAGEGGGALRLGVRSDEPAPATYSLRVTLDGVQTQSWPLLTLAPGQTWETTIVRAGGAGGAMEAVLSRTDARATVYRRVVLRPDETGNGR